MGARPGTSGAFDVTELALVRAKQGDHRRDGNTASILGIADGIANVADRLWSALRVDQGCVPVPVDPTQDDAVA